MASSSSGLSLCAAILARSLEIAAVRLSVVGFPGSWAASVV